MVAKSIHFSNKEYDFFQKFFADVLHDIKEKRIKYPGNNLGEDDIELATPIQKITNYFHDIKEAPLIFPNSPNEKVYKSAISTVSTLLRVMTEADQKEQK